MLYIAGLYGLLAYNKDKFTENSAVTCILRLQNLLDTIELRAVWKTNEGNHWNKMVDTGGQVLKLFWVVLKVCIKCKLHVLCKVRGVLVLYTVM